jgi:hypothetical protein
MLTYLEIYKKKMDLDFIESKLFVNTFKVRLCFSVLIVNVETVVEVFVVLY